MPSDKGGGRGTIPLTRRRCSSASTARTQAGSADARAGRGERERRRTGDEGASRGERSWSPPSELIEN
eukprot:14391078-Alexandrium_andersonii.AAC.1